jgi:DNA-binding CsgD family transcriptional regulator
MSDSWFLKGEMGDHSPWIIPLNKKDFFLGRGVDCDLVVNDSSVSRKHCRIYFQRDEPWVIDLESRNGTLLNGSSISEERLLRDGDILTLGRQDFLFSQSIEQGDEDKTIFHDVSDKKRSFAEQHGFSPREEEVLYLLIKGVAVKEIGEKLFISAGTAKNHVLKIYKKTHTHSRIELSTLYYQFENHL